MDLCDLCGAGFASGIPSQTELDRYYAEQSKYTYDGSGGSESIFDLKRFEVIVDQVAPYIKHSSRILDIGCATGGLLSVFNRRGFYSLTGADPSPACSEIARVRHNLNVQVATLSQILDWEEKFDMILMVGVLEHLREIVPALEAVIKMLSPGGLIYFAVPDVEGLTTSHNAPFQQFSMEHVNFFSSASLRNLCSTLKLAQKASWQYQIEWRENIIEPIVCGLYEKSECFPFSFDCITKRALEDYIIWSKGKDTQIAEIIAKLVIDQKPVIIWGTGALTRRLLATTRLSSANIVGFVDSSSKMQGQKINGYTVFSPAELKSGSTEILIGSFAFEKEIIYAIRSVFKLSNPIIRLDVGDIIVL